MRECVYFVDVPNNTVCVSVCAHWSGGAAAVAPPGPQPAVWHGERTASESVPSPGGVQFRQCRAHPHSDVEQLSERARCTARESVPWLPVVSGPLFPLTPVRRFGRFACFPSLPGMLSPLLGCISLSHRVTFVHHTLVGPFAVPFIGRQWRTSAQDQRAKRHPSHIGGQPLGRGMGSTSLRVRS